MDINIFTSKLFYNSIIKVKATNPVDFNNWSFKFRQKAWYVTNIFVYFIFFERKWSSNFPMKIDSVYYSNKAIIDCVETLKL
jgi:hypothetical protein